MILVFHQPPLYYDLKESFQTSYKDLGWGQGKKFGKNIFMPDLVESFSFLTMDS